MSQKFNFTNETDNGIAHKHRTYTACGGKQKSDENALGSSDGGSEAFAAHLLLPEAKTTDREGVRLQMIEF